MHLTLLTCLMNCNHILFSSPARRFDGLTKSMDGVVLLDFRDSGVDLCAVLKNHDSLP